MVGGDTTGLGATDLGNITGARRGGMRVGIS